MTASDIGNLRDGSGSDLVRVGLLGVALLLVTFGVSSIIGVVAGIVPATLAARMDPVEAIRTA